MGAFNYDATPLGPLGCLVMIHKNTSNRKSWDFRSKEGWSVSVSFEHYRCQLVIPANTIEINVSDKVEFLHCFITTPTLSLEDRILHGINTLSSEIQDKPTATYEAQIQAITKLRDICTGWEGIDTPKKSQVQEQMRPRHRSPRGGKIATAPEVPAASKGGPQKGATPRTGRTTHPIAKPNTRPANRQAHTITN